ALTTEKVGIAVSPNDGAAAREGTLTFKSSAGEATVKVTQAMDESFSISPSQVELTADGGTFQVTVLTHKNYHISSKPDWVTEKSLKDNVYTFEVGKNTDTSERSGVIVICDDVGTCLPCEVKQAGADVFIISPTKVEMPSDGGTFQVTVTATRSYHISSMPEWVKEKTLKDNVYTFEVLENTKTEGRSGVVVICDDLGTCLPCEVKQAAAEAFAVLPGQVTVPVGGGTFEVTVAGKQNYHLSSKPDWVTEKSVSNRVHTFEVGANETIAERSGVIVFCDDTGTCLPCSVTQGGQQPYLFIVTERLAFEMAGSTANVSISSNVKWTVTGSADWVELSPTEGERNGSVQVTVGRYEVQGSRSATITVRGEGGVSKTIAVEQQGVVPFGVSPLQVNLGKEGGTFEVQIASSYGYHINGMTDWITDITGTTQPQDKIHKFRVGPAVSSETRSGYVTFCDDKGTCLSVTVRQEGDPDQIDWSRDFYHRSLWMCFTGVHSSMLPETERRYKQVWSKYSGRLERIYLYDMYEDSDLSFGDNQALRDQYSGDESISTVIIDGRKRVELKWYQDPIASWADQALAESETYYPVSSAIGFQSAFVGQRLDMDVQLYLKKADDYKVTVFVTESGLAGYQNGVEENYPHDHVARIAVTTLTGDAFTVSSDHTIKKLHYSTTIPSGYKKDNLRILVIVQRAFGSQPRLVDEGYDYGNYYVDNCVSGKAGARVLPTLTGSAGGGNEDVIGGNPINW
ncbi:MAG: BACON domain-containing protein, partial [Bacteroidales bacterium]